MLWERSVPEQRYNAVLEVLEAGWPVVEVADRDGVSRQSVHAWVKVPVPLLLVANTSGARQQADAHRLTRCVARSSRRRRLQLVVSGTRVALMGCPSAPIPPQGRARTG